MPSITEWINGETASGLLLDPVKVAAFRRRHPERKPMQSASAHPVHLAPRIQPRRGVGAHLKLLLKEFGVSADLCGEGCGSFAAAMDAWGIEGCRQNREAILERLRQRYKETSWKTALNAAFQSVVTGNVFGMDVLHPIEWLVDEAIRRAESEANESRQSTPLPA